MLVIQKLVIFMAKQKSLIILHVSILKATNVEELGKATRMETT